MNLSNPELYRELVEFPLDDPQSTLRFTCRLARENGWSIDYAERVVQEYRRFLYLAMTANHTVSPSDQVDQAWHMHLTYTESYWNDLCEHVLKKPLHHGPTKGGADEGAKFHDLYGQTLDSYQAEFDEEPSADIWPPAGVRFGSDLSYQRVNTQRNWVIPKPRFMVPEAYRQTNHPTVAASAMLLGLGFGEPLNMRGPEFLQLFVVSFGISLFAALSMRWILRWEWGEREPTGEIPEVDLYETAYLAGGTSRVTAAATAALADAGCLRAEKSAGAARLVIERPVDKSAHPVEQAVYASIVAADGEPSGSRYAKFVSGTIAKLESKLAMKGLIETARSFAVARWVSVLAIVPVAVLGGAKIYVGLSREKPIGFLVFGMIIVVISMIWLWLSQPRCTRAGAALHRALADKHKGSKTQSLLQNAVHDPFHSDVAYLVALGGITAGFAATDPITEALHGRSGASSGWSGGGCGISGCGGGGCGGGGCGGCGGCGG